MIKKIKDLIFLFFYYRHKKNNFVSDVYVDTWHTLSAKDVGRYKTLIELKNGTVVNLCLVYVEEPGFKPKGIHFDIEYAEGLPYIRKCSFLEFYKLYKGLILYIVDNEEVLYNGY